jgi:hypothetical protein
MSARGEPGRPGRRVYLARRLRKHVAGTERSRSSSLHERHGSSLQFRAHPSARENPVIIYAASRMVSYAVDRISHCRISIARSRSPG